MCDKSLLKLCNTIQDVQFGVEPAISEKLSGLNMEIQAFILVNIAM